MALGDPSYPLECQSSMCHGPIKVIELGRRKITSPKRTDGRTHPPPKTPRGPPSKADFTSLPEFKHPKIPQRRKLPSQSAVNLESALQKQPKQKIPKKTQAQAFQPFPFAVGSSPKSAPAGSDGSSSKTHPGILEGDILELHGEKYEISSKLGTGGMGSVWAGRNQQTQKLVAIKEFFYSRFHDPESGNNFCEKYWNREKEIAEIQAESPEKSMHFIGALKLTQFPNPEYYIFLEYIEGEVLDKWYTARYPDLKDLTLSELRMLLTDILMPIARHMYYVHQQGIVHRDLTVQNIIITKKRYSEEFTPIVIDWGVAKHVSQMYKPRKPYYIASTPEATGIRNRGTPPEVMAGFEPIAATDIYMLGHVMFYLFNSGKYAGSAATNEDFVLHPGDYNPNLPPEFSRLVEFMTQYEPADRMESMVKVYDALQWLYNSLSSGGDASSPTPKQYYLYCSYNEAYILLPEKQVLTLGRDEIIQAGTNHEMDGHLFRALIPTDEGKFAFQLFIDRGFLYIRDYHSSLGSFLSNLTSTNRQVYSDIPIKGLNNVCVSLTPENLGHTTLEIPFIAPDQKQYRIQFWIIKK
jgi:serine/threonine-protein kinase